MQVAAFISCLLAISGSSSILLLIAYRGMIGTWDQEPKNWHIGVVTFGILAFVIGFTGMLFTGVYD